MAAVKRRDTRPELILRSGLRRAGLTGYRVDYAGAPGHPDVVFTRWRVAVFVDGAWWHGRPDRWHPEKASEFWRAKIGRNIERDREVGEALAERGWHVLRFWDDEVVNGLSDCVSQILAALADNGRPVKAPCDAGPGFESNLQPSGA